MRQRVAQGRKWLDGDVAEPSTIARALLVSRQSLYKQCKPRLRIVKPAPRPVVRELVNYPKIVGLQDGVWFSRTI